MQLKHYQEDALLRLERWIGELKKADGIVRETVEALEVKSLPVPEATKDYPRMAWKALADSGYLPSVHSVEGGLVIPEYVSRTAASGEPIPHACLKVPTGGGKTLLGVAALERIKQDTGFVLWMVPTKAIFEQTWKAFADREHPYRQMLEHASGRKFKLLHKDQRFTKQDIESYLCLMLLMLPAANRMRNKEFLKIFRDSSGYESFFPEQDNSPKNQQLADQHPDLEKNDGGSLKQSLFNTLKLIRPTVVLDEAHKAYGAKRESDNQQFVESVNRLNPRLVLELSATPKLGISNILVNTSGNDLDREEMIKLPIDILNTTNSNWQDTLAKAKENLDDLHRAARRLKDRENRYIRPIAVVRVERTGKNQRVPRWIHAEDARDYLMRQLAVPEREIRVKSSDVDELRGVDLLSDRNPVRWIITKDALKEGWDCPFAYVLVLLDNTKANTALTQLVGRVMRQPHAMKTGDGVLDRCYIHCFNQQVSEAVNAVKGALEAEGLTGLGGSVHGQSNGKALKRATVKRRGKYRNLEIFLPQVLHKQGGEWRPIDYECDILSAINWNEIEAGPAVRLADRDIVEESRIAVALQGEISDLERRKVAPVGSVKLEYFARKMLDIVPNPWQAARIVDNFLRVHEKQGWSKSKILQNRVYLSERMNAVLRNEIDKQAEEIFRRKVEIGEIRFHLDTNLKLNQELAQSFEIPISEGDHSLEKGPGELVQNSLFEPVFSSEFNNPERNFAIHLDNSDAIYWWHRIAARQGYFLQGWRKDRFYPDFLACLKSDALGRERLLILEMKGRHLQNPDTQYKETLFSTLERTYNNAPDRGEMTIRDAPASFRMIFEDTWPEKIEEIISESK